MLPTVLVGKLNQPVARPDKVNVSLKNLVQRTGGRFSLSWHNHIAHLDGTSVDSPIQVEYSGQSGLLIRHGAVTLHGKHLAIDANISDAPVTVTWQEQSVEYPGSLNLTAHPAELRMVSSVPMKDYVAGVITAETAQKDRRYLELMSIVVRTRAQEVARRYGNLVTPNDTTRDMVYKGRGIPAAYEATERTKGRMIFFGNKPAKVYFHACCGGYTMEPNQVFPGNRKLLPYLQGVSDLDKNGQAYCRHDPHFTWQRTVSRKSLFEALPKTLQLPGKEIPTRVDFESPLTLQRVVKPGLAPESFRMNYGRLFGWNHILSTKFRIIPAEGEQVTIEGSGFGHCIGLCQAGALARIREGQSIDAVIGHYFPGTRVRTEN